MTPNDLISGFIWHFILKPLAWAKSDLPIMETPISLTLTFIMMHLIFGGIVFGIMSKIVEEIFPKAKNNDTVFNILSFVALLIVVFVSIILQETLFPGTVNGYRILQN